MISFSCWVWWPWFRVNPETQTVSHSFPKLWAALQRKFGTDAAYRAGRRYVFGLASRERIYYQGHCLGFCSGDAPPFAESGSGRSLRRHASHLNDARCDAETILESPLIVGYSDVGQRLVAAEVHFSVNSTCQENVKESYSYPALPLPEVRTRKCRCRLGARSASTRCAGTPGKGCRC